MLRIGLATALLAALAAVGLSAPSVSQANVTLSLNGENGLSELAQFRRAKCRRGRSRRPGR